MPTIFTSKTQKIGEIGENLACKYLQKHGHAIIERNFTRKCGEIDIISSLYQNVRGKNTKVLHFIEVKASVVSNLNSIHSNPMENIHQKKIARFRKIINLYLLEKRTRSNMPFVVDIIAVYIDMERKTGTVSVLNDIVL